MPVENPATGTAPGQVPDSRLRCEITENPEYALLTVHLQDGESVHVEPGAMATMDANVQLKAGLKGGVLKSVGRALAGENMIISTFTAQGGEGEVALAPGSAGDIVHYAIRPDRGVFLQRGAFLAHSEGVDVSAKWGGAKGFFSGQGLILLKASGDGDLFFNAYGAIMALDVKGEYYVDTGYVTAFEDTLDYKVTTLPGLGIGSKIKTFFLGGEGLVCRFTGEGRVWVQTRAVHPFLNFIWPFRPQRSNN